MSANTLLISYFSKKMREFDFVPVLGAIQSADVRIDYMISVADLLEGRPNDLNKFCLVRSFCFNYENTL